MRGSEALKARGRQDPVEKSSPSHAYVVLRKQGMASPFALARKAAQMLPVSTFVHMTDEDDFGRPFPNTSALFSSPTADLVLSSSNSHHFRVHRAILSEASPIFNVALATLPVQTPSEPPPVQDLSEDGDTISILLQYIYPMPNPQINNLVTLRLALIAAQKYEVPSAIGDLKSALVSTAFLENDPVGVYSIACELGLAEEARIASRASLAFEILAIPLDAPCLDNLSAKDFIRLVRLHQARADAAIATIESFAPMPHDCCGYVCSQDVPSDSSNSSSQSRNAQGLPYVRWFVTWKAAAIPELRARPRSNAVFDSAWLLSHVKRASRHCHECGPTFMASATQAWLAVLKERVDSLPDTI